MRLRKWNSNSHAVVVAMHETPASFAGQLRDQIEWASRHFTLATPDSFSALWGPTSASHAPSKPLLLFTFDDGRESNYTVAAPLLEEFGGRGIFFVVPAFAETAGTENSFAFYRSRIHPDCDPSAEASQDWKPMNPAQIADLAARGHSIGNHTLTHERLINLSAADLQKEIGESSRKLTSWTGKPVDAFAWTFGWDAIDRNALQVIQRYHRFCFSPCAGLVNARRDHRGMLWRREVEARYPPAEYRFAYSGLVDLRWAWRRKILRSMGTILPAAS
jgi:peptidoglycan/xylan/chitin deacetylase (PgdA/CDA1 family)